MGRIGLAVIVVALGCSTPKAAEIPSPKTEAIAVEPVKAEPVKAEPVAEPVKAEPVKAEPVKAEPVKAEPVKAEPVKAEPVKAEPVKAEPVKAQPPKPASGKYTIVPIPAPDKKVERAWKSKCASCHGADGKAATEKGRKMKMNDVTLASWQTARTNAELKKVITDGMKGQKDGVTQEMDGYADLGAEQIEAMVQFTRWLGSR